MKKIVCFLFLFLAVNVLFAQVSVISVTDEDQHSTKEDFSHTFEYHIFPLKGAALSVGKCQATRIGRRWFATAAHCVVPLCTKGCSLRVDLLEQPVSAWAIINHTAQKPAVFVHPEYDPKELTKNDFALFRLDLDRVPLEYYRRGNGKRKVHVIISPQKFQMFLNQNKEAASQFYQLKSPTFPSLVLFDEGNYKIDRNISVISIFDGEREIKQNPYVVYYVKELGFAYTQNFGIRKGMSGSGVMTNAGELLGMISSSVETVIYEPGKKTKRSNFFMFPVFNRSIASFMEDTMGSDYYKLDWKDVYPGPGAKTRKDFSEVIRIFSSANKEFKKAPSK